MKAEIKTGVWQKSLIMKEKRNRAASKRQKNPRVMILGHRRRNRIKEGRRGVGEEEKKSSMQD
jgi:hypothetical protein